MNDKFIFFSAGLGLSSNVDKINPHKINPNEKEIGKVSNIINKMINDNHNKNIIKDMSRLSFDLITDSKTIETYIEDLKKLRPVEDINNLEEIFEETERRVFDYCIKNNKVQ